MALRDYGFLLRRRGLFLQRGPSAAASGWLGLNLATWGLPRKVQINPVVGVRHVRMERALAELAGWPAPRPSVSRSLGYLLPQNSLIQWDFVAGEDLALVAGDLARKVHEHGQPFIDRWSDWEVYASNIEGSGLLLDVEKQIVLPVVAALNGDRRTGEQIVQSELRRVKDARDSYADAYRLFAERYSSYSFS